MKNITRLSALIIGAAIAVSSASALTSEAIWDDRYAGTLTDIYAPPEGYEVFDDSELYRNYSEYFDYGAIRYRSIEDRQFFAAYYYFEFSHLELTVTDSTGWEDIYDKYSDELDMDSAKLLGDDKTVRIMDWVNCGSEAYDDVDAELQQRYDNIPVKYDKLMDMCAEMYEAGIIESAWYKPFSGISFPLCAISFGVKNYDGTAEELKALLSDISSEVRIKESAETFSVILNYEGASAEDYFACLDAVKALDGVKIINDDILVTEESGDGAPVLGGGTIDVVQMLQDESEKVYFENKLSDENDGRVGVTYIDENKITSEMYNFDRYRCYITYYSNGDAPVGWDINDTDIYAVTYIDKAPDISGIEGAVLLDSDRYSCSPQYDAAPVTKMNQIPHNYILVQGASAEELAALRYTLDVYELKEINETPLDAVNAVCVAVNRDIDEDELLALPGVKSVVQSSEYTDGQRWFNVVFEPDSGTGVTNIESTENCRMLLGCDFVDTAYPYCIHDMIAWGPVYGVVYITDSTLTPQDVDGDGSVTLTDAAEALRIYSEHAAGIEIAMSDVMTADTNEDGTVDLDDAAAVLTAYAGKGAGL